jgi:hypothetical protein
VHVDFVIKFLHGIIAWALSDNEQCYFWERFEGGKLDCLFSIEQLTGRWLFASGMRTGWMGFPTICNGKSGCRLFSGRTRFGALLTP